MAFLSYIIGIAPVPVVLASITNLFSNQIKKFRQGFIGTKQETAWLGTDQARQGNKIKDLLDEIKRVFGIL